MAEIVLLESFQEDRVQDIPGRYAPSVLLAGSDMPDDVEVSEDGAVAILAHYQQLRQFLHKKTLGRGHQGAPAPHGQSSGSTSSSGTQLPPRSFGGQKRARSHHNRPKKWSAQCMKSRSNWARCGKTGHWARECTNPSDERGRKRMTSINSFANRRGC